MYRRLTPVLVLKRNFETKSQGIINNITQFPFEQIDANKKRDKYEQRRLYENRNLSSFKKPWRKYLREQCEEGMVDSIVN